MVIVAEMIAVNSGLGYRILEAREYFWSGALDALTRRSQDELLRIWTELKQTIVFVTHGIEESLLLADRVGGDDVSSRKVEGNREGHAAQAARRGVARILGRPAGSHADGPRGTAAPRAR